jgi:hypothetical protein
LSANFWQAITKLRVNEGSEQRYYAAGNPRPENERRRMYSLGHNVRIHEHTGPDNATHDHHGGVK